ncbi:MAG: segregation/condensation protein A [Proteobacteria bacterium]|nr:segregation/condensation protein A [Pseudomonadota bacterium]
MPAESSPIGQANPNARETSWGIAPRQHKAELVLVLDGYEGPIDLLLDMATTQKIDLRQIAILPLAEQYLAFIDTAKGAKIDLAADYLVMAAWLAYLKSRLLLPDPAPEEQMEVAEMEEALRVRLLKLQAMRALGKKLFELPRLGQMRFVSGMNDNFNFAANDNTADQTKPADKPQPPIIWRKIALFDMLKAYGAIVSRKDPIGLRIEASHLHSVEDAVARLHDLIQTCKNWVNFLRLLPEGLQRGLNKRSAIASHFAAALEVVRDGKAALRQDKPFAPLYLMAAPTNTKANAKVNKTANTSTRAKAK